MADRAAARGPLLARRRVAVAAAYATVGLCQCGVVCAAPLSLARPGQESASVHGSNGTPDGAKPVRPLLLLLPERRMRMRCRRTGPAATTTAERTCTARRSRHAEMGWACSLPLPERQQLRPEGCSCTAPRNGTQHQCSTTAHTILCLCVVYIEPYTHTRMHGSPRTREKTLQPTASLLHASAFSLELESSLFTLPYWMESTGPATASQVNNSQVTVGVSGSYPPPCAALDLPAAACLVP
jgi:hypothetical protein